MTKPLDLEAIKANIKQCIIPGPEDVYALIGEVERLRSHKPVNFTINGDATNWPAGSTLTAFDNGDGSVSIKREWDVKWTRDVPTVSGFYWTRNFYSFDFPCIAEVCVGQQSMAFTNGVEHVSFEKFLSEEGEFFPLKLEPPKS